MTAETPELHIELRAPDGATWTSGESWASFKKRLEQLSSENTTIYSRLIHLEEQVDKLTRQERLMNALKILATETKPRTRGWVQNRVAKLSWGDFQVLVDSGKVKEVLHNKTRLYEASKE